MKAKLKELNMKVNWKEWEIGSKLIFVGFLLAILSMFMNWVDTNFVRVKGIGDITILLLVLWIYPVLKILKSEPLNKKIGMGLSIVSVLFTIMYISGKKIIVMGTVINGAGFGCYVYILASIVLFIGVYKYQAIEKDLNSEE